VLAAGIVAGIGHGLSFRAGLAAITAAATPSHRARAASSFFVVAYVAIALPVVGVGVLADATGLRLAGLVFAVAIGAIAASVLFLEIHSKEQAS
jgi:hypothetical protein